MFDRLRKAFSKDARKSEPDSGAPASQLQAGPVSEWAATQGFGFSQGAGHTLQLQGKVGTHPWRLEIGKPSRNYIEGEEVRARGELGLNEELSVLLLNRPLKEKLEKQAYSMFTDSLQTTADPNLPEEMRWLSMYEEVGWDGLPMEFWRRFAVLSDSRDDAMAWIDAPLAQLLMDWPEPAPAPEVPFMLLLMRGKLYMRMEYSPADMPVLQHAALVFTSACDAALTGFGPDFRL
jgi:hypothetical protein